MADSVPFSKIDKKEAEFQKWVGTIERTPNYYGTIKDLEINGIPKELWERLAEVCEPVKKALKVEKETPNFVIEKTNKSGTVVGYVVDIDGVADYLISQHNFKTWFGVKSDYSFRFDGRTFRPDTRGIVKVESEMLLGVHCKRNIVEEIFEKIKRKSKVDRGEFEFTDANFICLANGVWSINKRMLLPHNPKYNFQNYIPQLYDENAKCPKWLEFIKETLYPEDIPVMQEWFGFLLCREYFIKKGVIFEGDQDTGKSVLLDTTIKFIGEENKTGLSLQKITWGSDFTKLSLKNKHLNAFDDLSSKDLNDGGAFKVATGGGYISAEEKFGEFQQFRSFAKQMFATNKIPPVKDNDDLAYFGRWIVFKFDNVPEKIDPFLRKKLWTDQEFSGMLNWALEGLYRLLKNSEFSYTKTPEEVKQLMEISGCPLVAFSSECLEQENNSIITKDKMFQVYSLWCEKVKRPRLSKEKLGRNLAKYCSYILAEGGSKRVWKNVKFNDTSDTLLNNLCSDREKGITSKSSSSNDVMYTHNIISNKVSEVSKDTPRNTLKKEEIDIPLTENQIPQQEEEESMIAFTARRQAWKEEQDQFKKLNVEEEKVE